MSLSTFLSKLEFLVGFLLLAVITGLVFMAAIMRFAGNPLIWSVDMAQLLFIWLCFVGATRAMRQRAHLGVDFMVRFLPFKQRLVIDLVLTVVILAFLVALMWQGYKLTILNMEREFGDSGISYAFVTSAVPIGSFILSLSIIANLIETWRVKGEGRLLVFSSLNRSARDSEQ